LTEICLCDACSWHESEDGHARAGFSFVIAFLRKQLAEVLQGKEVFAYCSSCFAPTPDEVRPARALAHTAVLPNAFVVTVADTAADPAACGGLAAANQTIGDLFASFGKQSVLEVNYCLTPAYG
jgi:hypothetical protein